MQIQLEKNPQVHGLKSKVMELRILILRFTNGRGELESCRKEECFSILLLELQLVSRVGNETIFSFGHGAARTKMRAKAIQIKERA